MIFCSWSSNQWWPFLLEGKLQLNLAHLAPEIKVPAHYIKNYTSKKSRYVIRSWELHTWNVDLQKILVRVTCENYWILERERESSNKIYGLIKSSQINLTFWIFNKFFFHLLPLLRALSSRCKPSTTSLISFPRFARSVASCADLKFPTSEAVCHEWFFLYRR